MFFKVPTRQGKAPFSVNGDVERGINRGSYMKGGSTH
jgi:hypothetical protein